MFLELYINGFLRHRKYLDEDKLFRTEPNASFLHRTILRQQAINREKDKLKHNFYTDIECAAYWEILLRVNSRMNRFCFRDDLFSDLSL